MNYIFFGVPLVIFIAIFFLLKKCTKLKEQTILKGFSLFLAVAFFIRYFASPRSLFNNSLSLSGPFSSSFLSFCVLILVWFQIASVVILSLLPFFKFKVLKNLAKTFCLFVSFLSIGFIQHIAYSYTGTYDLTLCGAFIGVEIALCCLYTLYIIIKDGGFKMPKKEVIELLLTIPFVILFAIPPFLMGSLFGTVGSGLVKGFSVYHRLYLYLSFIVMFGLYFLFRKKDKEYIRLALLYISLVTLISYCYNFSFANFIKPTTWPLHLCNTAMFIIPLCLIFKWEKLFYFTFFINVFGAFIAMLMPSYTDLGGALNHEVVRFWTNHICAFIMPILIVFLGIYQRPNLKRFIYSMVGFLIYFLLVLIVNAWFTNYDKNVDFFFLNSDFIVSKLGTWAENTRNIQIAFTIGNLKFVFYPIYQIIFFFVYVLLGLAVWFVYTWIFQIQDFYIMLHKKKEKIKLDETALCVKYGKKEIYDCMNEKSVNKLVINNVAKRYGNNKIYSVKNASFEVNAGEILGFLGPNGAGKSTIIKCIVGIQPTTEGSIEINGYDIAKQPVLAKAQFGFVPDHYALYEKLTGREYINYIADLYSVPQDQRDARLQKMLKDLSMEANIDNQIRTYSHGMKQKIAIMSALIHNPKLWILDEPLTGLDPNSIFEVKECMKEHAKQGNIVFFSSHIIDIVEKLCDRIIIIKKGQIITTVTLKELQKKGISLEKFYLDIINAKDDTADMTYIEPEPEIVSEPTSRFFAKKEKKPKKNKQEKNEQV